MPLLPIEIDNNQDFEVEKDLDLRRHQNRLKYLIYWYRYDISERTWKPTKNLANVVKKIEAFH